MKNKIILVDVDGTIVNWNSGFNKFMADSGLPQLPNTDNEYSITVRHGIPLPQAHKLIREFNESPLIAELAPFADSVEYISKLVDSGFRFIAVTSLSDAPMAYKHRSTNLSNIFGDVFDEINCLPMGACKSEILKRWKDTGYFWIEDHSQQAEAGHRVGLKTILINHPYNAYYISNLFPTVSYITPWKEIYNMVSNEYQL